MLLGLLALTTGCGDDACERLCRNAGRRLRVCQADWPVDWSDFDASSQQDFTQTCQNRWSEVRSELEPRELDDALDQCDETIVVLDQLEQDGEDCDVLRALYLWE